MKRKALLVTSLGAVLVLNACTARTEGKQIPQPLVKNLELASKSKRVDLKVPTFSNPTRVTNPLFPVSRQKSVLFAGHVDGKPFRTEVTLLPFTRIIAWEGQRVETLVSQYTAYLDRRIQEVAYDYYAQADDGSVWYFGEDVADLDDGVIVTKEGTWIAGKDGPAAMIMPGHPKVGDAYRTENAPGIAFEEVSVEKVNQTLKGPLGPIKGGMIGKETHFDPGDIEGKTFAPGYGEFYTASGGDVEALALAVPTDAASGPVPAALVTLRNGAAELATADGSKDPSATLKRMTRAWKTYRSGNVPRLIEPVLTAALGSLESAIARDDTAKTRQAAIDVAQSTLDLQLRYRPVTAVDLARLALWTDQTLLDVDQKDEHAVNGDAFTLDYIRDRILGALDKSEHQSVNISLLDLQTAVADGDLKAVAEAAKNLHETVTSTTAFAR